MIGGFFNAPVNATAGMVEADGTNLTLDGKPYVFAGVNRYDLLTHWPGGVEFGCGGVWTNTETETALDELKAMGATVIRVWAFQKFIYGTGSTANWTRMDYVLAEAAERDLKVIPVLENHWDSNCSQGGTKSESWYDTGYQSAYGAYDLSLPSFVSAIVNRYDDNTAVAFWQIMNEAQAGNSCNAGSGAILRDFADDIAGDIQAIDSNHLVSFGTHGDDLDRCGADTASDYEALHDLDSIDMCEYHDYRHITDAYPTATDLLSGRVTQCNNVGKPMLIGEAGIKACGYSGGPSCSLSDCTGAPSYDLCYTQSQRRDYFDAKMDAAVTNGIDGYLIWGYRDHAGISSASSSLGEFGPSDPLVEIVKEHADSDQDGWSNRSEPVIGTDAFDGCGLLAWPPDINNDTFVDTRDISLMNPWMGYSVPPAPARVDLAGNPPSGYIDTADMSRVTGLFGQGC